MLAPLFASCRNLYELLQLCVPATLLQHGEESQHHGLGGENREITAMVDMPPGYPWLTCT